MKETRQAATGSTTEFAHLAVTNDKAAFVAAVQNIGESRGSLKPRRVFRFSPFAVWFHHTGQRSMMLPLGHSATGLPLAVQIVAPYGDEATLFRLGAQLEAARPWFGRKPALVA